MYQQLWGYKVEDKLYLGVREQKRLNTTALEQCSPTRVPQNIVRGSSRNRGIYVENIAELYIKFP
jgi:hypothetical protein